MKILILEDDVPIQLIIKAMLAKVRSIPTEDEDVERQIEMKLSEMGYELECATDGDEAYRSFCEHSPFDLVLTDIAHPGMDGLKLVECIRRNNPLQAMVVMSASTSRDVDHVLWQRFKVILLHKPFESWQLEQAIELATLTACSTMNLLVQ